MNIKAHPNGLVSGAVEQKLNGRVMINFPFTFPSFFTAQVAKDTIL